MMNSEILQNKCSQLRSEVMLKRRNLERQKQNFTKDGFKANPLYVRHVMAVAQRERESDSVGCQKSLTGYRFPSLVKIKQEK